MMISYRNIALAAVAALCLAGSQARASVIDTTGSYTGTTEYTWGTASPNSYSPTYGQTFTAAPGYDVLTSALFKIELNAAGSLGYTADVYAWTGTATSGSALATTTGTVSGTSFTSYTANFGSLSLTDANQYIVLFTTIGQSNSPLQGTWEAVPASAYTGGAFEYSNVNSTASWVTASNWNPTPVSADLAFTFSFGAAAVPEPSTWALMTVGAMAVAGGALRRRKTSVVS